MIMVRKSEDRGYAHHGWLESYHTFSFASYHDKNFMGFRNLRVINEDFVEPGQGFGTHPHNDMEILTYIISGDLAHKDSMGNGRIIKAGEVQGMSAGTGITHSEFNASDKTRVHLLQIWITPHTKGVTPAYSEWLPNGSERKGWALAASGDKNDKAIHIYQDAKLYVAECTEAKTLPISLADGRFGWVQVAKGSAEVKGYHLLAGDGVAFEGSDVAEIKAGKNSSLLWFDLP
ncbi:MAG: pirin family protein [Alphaproteobacteria bacterium]